MKTQLTPPFMEPTHIPSSSNTARLWKSFLTTMTPADIPFISTVKASKLCTAVKKTPATTMHHGLTSHTHLSQCEEIHFWCIPRETSSFVSQLPIQVSQRKATCNKVHLTVIGVWLFHCHIEWHMDTGLIATMISSPLEMQKTLTIPQEFKQICSDQGISTVGNAAGNTEDYLDLSGQNLMVPPLPAGFTTKGYVAMVFSCVAGVLGLASITL